MIGTINPNKSIQVIGGGFSGLVLSYFLQKKYSSIALFEKDLKLGGKIKTEMTPWGPIESAAHAIFLNNDFNELLNELNITPILAQKKLKRLIWHPNKLVSPADLTDLVSVGLKVLKSPPPITDELTVEDFFKPLLGKKRIDNILSPALQGIYACNAHELHFKSIFKSASQLSFKSYLKFILFYQHLLKSKKSKPSGSASFNLGMGELINSLSKNIQYQKLNFDQYQFNPSKNNIFCTSAIEVAQILSPHFPNISKELEKIEYLAAHSLTFISKDPIISLKNSFGVLFPTHYQLPVLGLLNNSEIFPELYKDCYSYTLIHRYPLKNFEEIYFNLNKLIPLPPLVSVLTSRQFAWEKALPLYNQNRFVAIENLKNILKKTEGVCLFGNYTEGISLREIVTSSKNTLSL